VERATRSDPYPRSPHDPPAAPGADSSLLDEAIVCGGEAELSRRCARHGSPLSAVAPSESAVARAAAANAVLSTYYPSVIRAGAEQRDQSSAFGGKADIDRLGEMSASDPKRTSEFYPKPATSRRVTPLEWLVGVGRRCGHYSRRSRTDSVKSVVAVNETNCGLA